MVCNFFFEYKDVPKEERHDVEDGRLKEGSMTIIDRETHEASEVILRRDIRVSVVIPAHQISGMANWMLDKLKSSGIIVEKGEG